MLLHQTQTVAIGMGDGGTVTFGNVSGGVRAYDAMIPLQKKKLGMI